MDGSGPLSLMGLQSRCSPGLQPSEVITGLEDLQPVTWLVNESWLSAGALVLPHTDLSLGLLECPHNMVADRPPGPVVPESKKEAAVSILTYLRGYARSFPQDLGGCTVNPVRVGVGCTQEHE